MNRRNIGLLFVWLALLAAAVAVERPWEGDAFERTRSAIGPLFPGFRARMPGIGRVEISSRSTLTSLVRFGDRWIVEERYGHPADAMRLVQLLESVAGLTTRNAVSDNPERREQFSVAEADGTRIRFFEGGGGLVADLVSGGLRPQEAASGAKARLEFFVRPAGGDTVYLAPFQPPVVDPADWLQAQPIGGLASPSQVRWIERDESERWRVVRAGSGGSPDWRMVAPDDVSAEPAAAESMASAVAGLRILDVAAALDPEAIPGDAMGFGEGAFRIGIGDGEIELRFGAVAPGGGRYAWIRGLDYVYRVPEYFVQALRKTAEDFTG